MVNKTKALDFLLLLFSFLYGNLFTIQFSNVNWGIVFIFFIIILIEFINLLIYLKPNSISFFSAKKNIELKRNLKFLAAFEKKRNKIGIILNTIKRGFILGFFIEAFKVGS